jgi:hypothetical protein
MVSLDFHVHEFARVLLQPCGRAAGSSMCCPTGHDAATQLGAGGIPGLVAPIRGGHARILNLSTGAMGQMVMHYHSPGNYWIATYVSGLLGRGRTTALTTIACWLWRPEYPIACRRLTPMSLTWRTRPVS